MANQTLTEKEAQTLLKLNETIDKAYEKRNELVKKIITKYGPCETVLKTADEEKPYRRVKIVDELENFQEGNTIYRTAALSRFGVNITKLKNEPKTKVTTKNTPVKTTPKRVSKTPAKNV